MQELSRIFIYEILYNDVSSTRFVLNQVSFTSCIILSQINNCLIDWIVFYVISAIFQTYYYGNYKLEVISLEILKFPLRNP